MLQVARLAPKLLADSSSLVQQFITSQLQPGGGFADRAGRPDLYYTVFGLESLLALCKEVPAAATSAYLSSFGNGQGLDFVHLCCLARCWASVARDVPSAPAILENLEAFRRSDGGYDAGTVYTGFLALGAYQDLRTPLPDAGRLLASLRPLHPGLTTTTAAAVMLLRHLGEPPSPALGEWLLAQAHPQGGFRALPGAPIPDLLSTATALHALSAMHIPIDAIRENCLDFIDTLWVNRGAFHGSWADDELDCEYTYYALLALGHLAI